MSQARMRQLLAEMSIISEGRTSQLEGKITGGEHDYQPRRGDPVAEDAERNDTLGEYWFRRYQGAPIDLKPLVVLEAEKALHRARVGRQAHKVVRGTLEWRLAISRDPRPVAAVMDDYEVSRSYVYRLRARRES